MNWTETHEDGFRILETVIAGISLPPGNFLQTSANPHVSPLVAEHG